MSDRKEYMREYALRNKEHIKEYGKKYRLRNREHAKEYRKEYRLCNKEKIAKQVKEYNQKYDKTEKCKAYRREYAQSEKGKEVHRKSNNKNWAKIYQKHKDMFIKKSAKRNRKFNWIQMFSNPFDDSEEINWHHINDAYVVALPKDLHLQYLGKYHRENTMEIVKQIYLK